MPPATSAPDIPVAIYSARAAEAGIAPHAVVHLAKDAAHHTELLHAVCEAIGRSVPLAA